MHVLVLRPTAEGSFILKELISPPEHLYFAKKSHQVFQRAYAGLTGVTEDSCSSSSTQRSKKTLLNKYTLPDHKSD